jgi:hypothetical protein
MKKKPVEHICKNCKLFDPVNKRCNVVILHEGERIKLPVDAEDKCFFEQQFQDPKTGEWTDFNEIKEVRFWTEDEDGKKTAGDGTVKMQYPEGFFGASLDDIIG